MRCYDIIQMFGETTEENIKIVKDHFLESVSSNEGRQLC